MIKRRQPGEVEDDILRMQEEFIKEKSKNLNHQPAAQVVDLRKTEPTERSNESTESDVPVPMKPKLETTDEEIDQVKLQKGRKEDTEGIISNGDFNENSSKIFPVSKMKVENTGVTDVKIEKELDDEVESEIDLYAEHLIKEEIFVGPVVIQPVVYTSYCPEDVPVPKKPKLKIDQVKPQKGMKADNTEGIISNVDFNENPSTIFPVSKMKVENTEGVTDVKIEKESYNEVESVIDLYAEHVIKEEVVVGPVVIQRVVYTSYCPEDVPVPKKPKLETDQVKQQKGMKEDNTEAIISNDDFNENSSTNIKTNTTLRNNEQTNYYNLRKRDQTPRISENVLISKKNEKENKKKESNRLKKNRSKSTLAKHILCHQKIRQKKHLKCKECTSQTKSEDSLKKHYKQHDKDINFKCDMCDYSGLRRNINY